MHDERLLFSFPGSKDGRPLCAAWKAGRPQADPKMPGAQRAPTILAREDFRKPHVEGSIVSKNGRLWNNRLKRLTVGGGVGFSTLFCDAGCSSWRRKLEVEAIHSTPALCNRQTAAWRDCDTELAAEPFGRNLDLVSPRASCGGARRVTGAMSASSRCLDGSTRKECASKRGPDSCCARSAVPSVKGQSMRCRNRYGI